MHSRSRHSSSLFVGPLACARVQVLALSLALPGLAHACSATITWPIVEDRQKPGYREEIHMLVDAGTNVSYSGCPVGANLEMTVNIQGPGLRWVMDLPEVPVWPVDGGMPLYESGPDSPLIGFATTYDGPRTALRLGSNTLIYPVRNSSDSFIINAFMFSRGQKMRDTQTLASLDITASAHPGFDVKVPVDITIAFPPTTCSMRDVAEVLQDVTAAELGRPGDSAREKPLALRMECGAAQPRADMVLRDAGDASNSGSILSATADSTARGVRMQLLSAGVEVQFGKAWFFNPGTGGNHDFPFTARYIRTDEPLVPGLIKGEAVLSVDYW
ncbi:fimbrial protein [Stenotrophomonas cyclobalanopsidis]|nr:fimbrial protein [Stenotrophomonas cyclobalanopsidis]